MSERAEYVVSAMLEEGIISQENLDDCAAYVQEHNVPLAEALVASKVVTRRQIAITMAEISECQYIDLDAYEINIRNSQLLAQSAAEQLRAFPLFHLGESIAVGMIDPLDLTAVDQLRRLLKAEVEPVLCEQQVLHDLIDRAYSLSAGSEEQQAECGQGSESLVTG